MSHAQRLTRHVWGFLGAIGLFVMVIAGAWGCMIGVAGDPASVTAGVVALAGLATVVASMAMRGESGNVVRWAGRFTGGIGILVSTVAGSLSLLAAGIAPDILPILLVATVAGLAAWAMGASLQGGVAFLTAFQWLAAISLVGGGLVGGLVALTMLGTALGLDVGWSMRLAFVLVVAILALTFGSWARGRPDRGMAPGAIVRLGAGRPRTDDRVVLDRGPLALVVRQPAEPGIGPESD
jgi:hypothetical protein